MTINTGMPNDFLLINMLTIERRYLFQKTEIVLSAKFDQKPNLDLNKIILTFVVYLIGCE